MASKQKKILGIMLVVIQIFICYCFIVNHIDKLNGNVSDVYKKTFTTNELKSTIGVFLNDKYSISSDDIETEQEIVFTYGPYTTLQRGEYKATIHYESTEDNRANLYSSELNDTTFNNQTIILSKDENTAILYFSLDKTIADFELQTKYSGKGDFSISSIEIESTNVMIENNKYATITRILALIELFIVLDLLCIYFYKNKKELLYVFILLGAGILISSPSLLNYVVDGSETTFQLGRIYGLRDALLQGNLFAKLQTNWVNDYGYLVGVFQGDLPLFIPAILNIIGIPMEVSYRLFIIIINIVTLFIGYICFKKIFGNNLVGLFGSVIYSFSAYRLTHVYLTQSIGEYCAFIFVPIVAYGFYKLFHILNIMEMAKKSNAKFTMGRTLQPWIILSIGFFGLINSHMLSFGIVLFFVLVFLIIQSKHLLKWYTIKNITLTIITTLVLSASYLVPMIDFTFFKQGVLATSINENVFSLNNRGLLLSQFFEMFPNINKVTFASGLTLTLGLFLGCATMILVGEWKKVKKLTFYIFFSLVGIFMATIYFPWDMLKTIPLLGNVISYIQFPWRFSLITTLMQTLVICESITLLKETNIKQNISIIAMTLLTITLISSMYLLNNVSQSGEMLSFQNAKDLNLLNTKEEYLPANTNTTILSNTYQVINGTLEVKDYDKRGTNIDIDVVTSEDTTLEVPLFYYPYYTARLNGEYLNTYSGNNNVITIDIPSNANGVIHISYEVPQIWRICYIINSISVLLLFVYLTIYYLRRFCTNNNIVITISKEVETNHEEQKEFIRNEFFRKAKEKNLDKKLNIKGYKQTPAINKATISTKETKYPTNNRIPEDEDFRYTQEELESASLYTEDDLNIDDVPLKRTTSNLPKNKNDERVEEIQALELLEMDTLKKVEKSFSLMNYQKK